MEPCNIYSTYQVSITLLKNIKLLNVYVPNNRASFIKINEPKLTELQGEIDTSTIIPQVFSQHLREQVNRKLWGFFIPNLYNSPYCCCWLVSGNEILSAC